jgi:hypothetical protein
MKSAAPACPKPLPANGIFGLGGVVGRAMDPDGAETGSRVKHPLLRRPRDRHERDDANPLCKAFA